MLKSSALDLEMVLIYFLESKERNNFGFFLQDIELKF